MATHNDFGKDAEAEAVRFLIQNNYKILERNWRFLKAEIDIIAIDETASELVIIEVKSLNSDSLKNPEEAVNKKKRKLLIIAADHYVTSKSITLEVRFDIISMLKRNSSWKIIQIKNAFQAYEN